MDDIILIGDGGHCHACIDVIESCRSYRIKGVVEKERSGRAHVLDYPIIGCDEELTELIKETPCAVITVGQIKSSVIRKRLFRQLKDNGAHLASVVSGSAYVSQHAKLGEGTVIMHHALVNARATIEANCIINTGAIIEHDVRVEAHCHISTRATINGGCIIEAESFIGSGAIIREGVIIGKGSVIAAGITVRKDVPPGSTVFA